MSDFEMIPIGFWTLQACGWISTSTICGKWMDVDHEFQVGLKEIKSLI
jgi:hypothetical protein